MVIEVISLTKELANIYGKDLLALNDCTWENWSLENLLADRTLKWEISYFVKAEGNLAGYAIASLLEPKTAHLHHIVISHSYRGIGIGRKLFLEISEKALGFGAQSMTLKVLKTNIRAINLYERIGFRKLDFDNCEYFKMIASLDEIINNIKYSI